MPSWVLQVVRVRRRAGVDAQRAADDVDALDVAVAVDETSMSWVPKRRCFHRSTVRFGGCSGMRQVVGQPDAHAGRGRAATSSAGVRSSTAIGRPAEPSSPLPRAENSGASSSSWSSTTRSWMSPPWRITSTPSNTSNTCGHSSARASGMCGVGDQPDAQRGTSGQHVTVQRDHLTIDEVRAGRRCHRRDPSRSPALPATCAARRGRRRPARPPRLRRAGTAPGVRTGAPRDLRSARRTPRTGRSPDMSSRRTLTTVMIATLALGATSLAVAGPRCGGRPRLAGRHQRGVRRRRQQRRAVHQRLHRAVQQRRRRRSTVDGWSVQYASSAGTAWTNTTNLTGSIPRRAATT